MRGAMVHGALLWCQVRGGMCEGSTVIGWWGDAALAQRQEDLVYDEDEEYTCSDGGLNVLFVIVYLCDVHTVDV